MRRQHGRERVSYASYASVPTDRLLLLLLLLLVGVLGPRGVGSQAGAEPGSEGTGGSPHSRQKRLLWVTNDGRLALPPGTAMTITPTLSLPFVRYPPDGFLANLSISLPFTILFDKLGLTDNENPYGVLPPLLARSASRSAGEIVADYIGDLLSHRRRAREAPENGEKPRPPIREPTAGVNLHGGERAVLYTVVEDLLDNFGMDGKACLLRAICEVHAKPQPIKTLGVLGEVLHLFLTASKSPYAALLAEYVQAESTGRGGEESGEGHGECWPYYRDCSKSIFRPKSMYTKEASSESEPEIPVEQNLVM